VIFITKDKGKLHRQLPLLPLGLEAPPAHVLSKIQIMYCKDDEMMRKLFCCISLMESNPCLIVIDGFSSMFKQFSLSAVAKTFAFLKEAIDALQRKGQVCPILLSDEVVPGNSPSHRSVKEICFHWIPFVLQIKGGKEPLAYELYVDSILGLPDRLGLSFGYSIVNSNGIQLTGIFTADR